MPCSSILRCLVAFFGVEICESAFNYVCERPSARSRRKTTANFAFRGHFAHMVAHFSAMTGQSAALATQPVAALGVGRSERQSRANSRKAPAFASTVSRSVLPVHVARGDGHNYCKP